MSLKDENLSKSNALFLDNELQPGFEVAKRRVLQFKSILQDQAQNSTPGSCSTTHILLLWKLCILFEEWDGLLI